MKIITTLKRIREHNPCTGGWVKLLAGLGKKRADDEPLDMLKILEINGLDDCLWCFRAEPQHGNAYRLVALDFIEPVRHLITNPHSINALVVARRHAHGKATDDELAAAWDASWDAVRTAAWDEAWVDTAAMVAARAAQVETLRAFLTDNSHVAALDCQKTHQNARDKAFEEAAITSASSKPLIE